MSASEVNSDSETNSDTENDENLNYFDSLKADFQQENVEDWSDSDEEEDVDELMAWEWCKEDPMETMVKMMLEDDSDDSDLDWMPEKLKNKAGKRKEKDKGECL